MPTSSRCNDAFCFSWVVASYVWTLRELLEESFKERQREQIP